MCGLCGSFTEDKYRNLTQKHRLQRARVLEGLLVANAARGTDATGVANIDGAERSIYKRAKASIQFVDDPLARKALRSPAPLTIGHTRYGTMGGNTDENAHPFEEINVVGAHNGVISNYGAIETDIRTAAGIEYKDWDACRVDTQAAFRLLDHVGPANYIEAFKRISGSAALVWHDLRNPKALWMVSHSNPLNAAWVPTLGTLFWSSQYDHLSSVLWSQFGDNWLSVSLKENTLYMFKSEDILKFQQWPVTFKSYTTVTHGGTTTRSWGLDDGYYDPDYDADAVHPFGVASVSRKAGSKAGASDGTEAVTGGKGGGTTTKGKAKAGDQSATVTSPPSPTFTSRGIENVIEVLGKMGVPMLLGDEGKRGIPLLLGSASPASSSAVSTPEATTSSSSQAASDDAIGNANGSFEACAICDEEVDWLDEGVTYVDDTRSFVCAKCHAWWANEENQAVMIAQAKH